VFNRPTGRLLEDGTMTEDDAREAAIRAGALEPQGVVEQMACNFQQSNDWSFRWSDTARARARLEAWTNAILNGVPPHELRSRVG
jgi:hypothetical protein